MTLKKEIKIAIVDSDKSRRTVVDKYVKEICAAESYPLTYTIENYNSVITAIEELEDDCEIIILNNESAISRQNEIVTSKDLVESVEKNCDDCKIILLARLKKLGKRLKDTYSSIYSVIDKSQEDRFYLGKSLQDILANKASQIGPQKVM